MLRHQLIVLQRKMRGRPRLTNNDRWFFIQPYRWFPSILQVLAIIRPEALVECYRRQGIMIRQGTYHTERFGDRFVKVSTSVPSPWVEKFCTLLPEMVTQARTLNDLPPQS